jgi:hypothetical protein
MPGISCSSSMRLTEAEVTWLDNLSHAAHEVTGPVRCELEAEHPGRHVGLAQADDIGGADGPEINYWAWWADDSAHEISNENTCEAEDPKGELCLLPVGHPGRHLY